MQLAVTRKKSKKKKRDSSWRKLETVNRDQTDTLNSSQPRVNQTRQDKTSYIYTYIRQTSGNYVKMIFFPS